MSTVTAKVLDYDQPPPQATAPERFAFLRKNSFALADQVLISGTNFVTMVLTARALTQGEFGTFSIIYGVLLLANILQSTLITQAHNVLGATRVGRDYQRYTGSTAVQQIFVVLFEAILIVPVVLWAHAHGWAATGMLLALIPAIIFWQLMEFVRRVLYTEGRYAAAFLNDMISYGGQTALLIGLYIAHRRGVIELNGAMALYTLGSTALLATIFGVWQLRKSAVFSLDLQHVRENWHFGKWLLGGEMLAWSYSLHMQVWWAAWLIGVTASADLRAAQILFGPMRVITFFLGTVLPIRFARALHAGGPAAMHHKLKSVYRILIPTVGAYCLLLALFPEPLLKLVYGSTYAASDAPSVLRLYALSAFLSYLQMVIAAALTARRHTRAIFLGSIWGCVLALVMSPICIKAFGSNGAIITIIVTTLAVTIAFARTYFKTLNTLAAGEEGAS
jgi:O-antigen/teichoic acid export membrane protein